MNAGPPEARKYEMLAAARHQKMGGERKFAPSGAWNFVLRLVIIAITTLVVLFSISGLVVDSLYAACMIALVFALVNACIPYLVSMSRFALSLATLGVFALVINCFLLYLASQFHAGVSAASFTTVMTAGVTISVITWFSTLAIDSQLIIKS